MAPSHRNGGDRLSALPDKALQRVLSHLMSDEAVRTSGLSRRWRHVHEGVPVVHLVDTKAGERYGRCGSGLKVCFDHQVTSAIMGKGIGTPIRAFRVSADPRPRPVRPARPVDRDRRQLRRRGPRRRAQVLRRLHGHALLLPPLPHPRNEALGGLRQRRHQQVHEYALPHLRLPHAPPAAPHQLDARSAGGRAHGGAGDALPRKDHGPSRGAAAAHLRLPGPRQTDAGGVPHHQGDGRDARPPTELRHDLLPPRHRRPAADHLPRVAALQGRPSSPWLVLHHRRKLRRSKGGQDRNLRKLTWNPGCEQPNDVAPVTNLIRRCAKRAYLHLSLRPSMACNLFTGVLRGLDSLTHLSLQGCLPTDDAVLSVSTLLTEAKNLEVLSLFPLGPEPPKNKRKRMHRGNDDDESDSDSEPEDGPVEDGVKYSSRLPKRLRQTYARCLAHKVRRINIANFEGRPLEKMLARFLLSRAVALEEFSVTLAAGVHPRKAEITKELISWRQNRRARVTCNLD